MPDLPDQFRIVVAGDVTVDWNLAHVPSRDGAARDWSARRFARMSAQPGGAALVAQLVTALAQRNEGGLPRAAVFAASEPRPGSTYYSSGQMKTLDHIF